MRKTTTDKADIMMGLLAKGVYRPWFWQQTRMVGASLWRQRWLAVCFRFQLSDLCDGLRRWESDHGADCPPDPQAFADFIKPKLSVLAKQHLQAARSVLGIDLDRKH